MRVVRRNVVVLGLRILIAAGAGDAAGKQQGLRGKLDHRTGHGAVAWLNTNDCRWWKGEPGFGIDTAALALNTRAEAVVPSSRWAAEEQQRKFPYDLNKDHWSFHNLTVVSWHQCRCTEGPDLFGILDASLGRVDWEHILGPEWVFVESVDSQH